MTPGGWLAYHRSVEAVRKSWKPLRQTMENIYTDTGDPAAFGIFKIIGTFEFVAAIMLLSDLLPHLVMLSKSLQAKKSDFSPVKSGLQAVKQKILDIKQHPFAEGSMLANTEEMVNQLEIQVPDMEQAKDRFNRLALQPYLTKLESEVERQFEDCLGVMSAFSIFDPSNRPDASELKNYGQKGLKVLTDFYGETTKLEFDAETYTCEADIDTDDTMVEWTSSRLLSILSFLKCLCREWPNHSVPARQNALPLRTYGKYCQYY